MLTICNHERWTTFVAKRYLRSKKKVKFLNLTSLLSAFGIGLGVAAIMIVLAVMNGFEYELKQKLMNNDLHVLITPQPTFAALSQGDLPRGLMALSALEADPVLSSFKSDPRVELFTPVLSTEVILKTGNKVSGVLFKGLDATRLSRLMPKVVEKALPQMLIEREGPETSRYPSVWVGKELAYEMGIIPGDFITLISPTINDGPFSNIPRMKRLVVEGVYSTGVPEQESQEIYATTSTVESFLRLRGFVSQIEITLKHPDESMDWVTHYQKQERDLKIRNWNELNLHLFASMKLERIAMFLILLFTVLIASLNIVSTLTLMVQEKLKEIAILKTLGAREKDISFIYLRNGLWVGGVGVGVGALFGLLVCLFLAKFPIIQLPEVYYDRTLPIKIDVGAILAIVGVSFLIVLLASYFPAKKAALLTPLEGIRAS